MHFTSAAQILGIHFDPPFIFEAIIQKGRKKIEIRSLKAEGGRQKAEAGGEAYPPRIDHVKPQYTTPSDEASFGGPLANVKRQYTTPPDEASFGGPLANVKRLYIFPPSAFTLLSSFKGRIVSGISAKNSLIRPIDLKVTNSRHREEMVEFQSEASSHFTPGEMLTVPLFGAKKKGNEALLFSVPRSILQNHLEQLEAWGIDADAVSSVPLALCHYVRWKFPDLSDAFIIDIGSSEWTCVWMEKGMLKKAHAIAGGVESLLGCLLEDRKKILLKKEIEGAAKQIDLLLLKPGLNPHLTAKLNELRQELLKVHYAFQRGSERKPIIFTGRTDAFIHLSEFLIDSSESEFPLSLEEQKFAIAVGLGLSQIDPEPLQFRREEFFPKKNWRKMGVYGLSLIACSLLLSSCLLFFGLSHAHQRKEGMFQSIPLAQKKKNLLEGSSLEEKIDHWIAAVETHNKEYPYILQAPKVAEVYAWLSSHPLLEELKKEGDPIDIREIKYELLKFPKIDSPKEPYLAKLELDFRVKSATNARRFHEELRKGGEWVDEQAEITWDSLRDGYRTSFFLKNRGRYGT